MNNFSLYGGMCVHSVDITPISKLSLKEDVTEIYILVITSVHTVGLNICNLLAISKGEILST